MDINYIKQLILKGNSLKDISLSLGMSPGYVSNYLKRKKITLFNEEIIKINKRKIVANKLSKQINIQKLTKNIIDGLSSSQIAIKNCCTNVHVKRFTKKMLPEYYNNLILNGIKRRNSSMKGKKNLKWQNNKGKTYEEIYGSKEKADEMRKKRSTWLSQNNIRKFATKISKPQAILFGIVKSHFPSAEIEFEVNVNNIKKIYLDIAIPEYKICIEYDGLYWHKKNKTTISMKDSERDAFLKNLGWRVYRIQSYKNLNESELKSEFFKLKLKDE
jgi:very-short-patch-repair endonuclease/predicted transcriptional regulator